MAQFGIIGSKGRMGQALASAIEEAGHGLAGGVDQGEKPGPLAASCDALIDFSSPDALEANLAAARVAGVPILIGTTGLDDPHHAAMPAHLDVGLVHPPVPPQRRGALYPAQALLDFRRVALHPAVDGGVIDGNAALGQHLL